MKLKLIKIFVLALAVCQEARGEIEICNKNRFKVYSVSANTKEQWDILQELYTGNNENEIDFWTKPKIKRKTDVMVFPEGQADFKDVLEKHNISYEVKVEDVQVLIDQDKIQNSRSIKRDTDDAQIGWDFYMRYDEIQQFINKTAQEHSDLVTVKVIGQSYEKRNIYSVKISNSPDNKKAIFIDANIHAREWITSATATWVINQLAQNSSLLNGIDWYIVPMVNPDGYEYTHTVDRTWKKTRSINSGSSCRGVDPNRNFPILFGGEGTSSNACSGIFKGPEPLSEPETKALAEHLQELKNSDNFELEAYISFHSYGQLWLLPWGYSSGTYPDDFDDQENLGKKAVSAIYKVNGTQYELGTPGDILYPAGGTLYDWAKFIGIKYSATIEMRDEGQYGFLLPPDQIQVNAQEIFSALSEVARRINPK